LQNYEHKKLIETITKLDEVPIDPHVFSEWIKAHAHLEFLRKDAQSNELVVYASGEYSFIHSVVVSNDKLFPINRNDLKGWNLEPYKSCASYVTGGGRNDVWIERGLRHTGTKSLEDAVQLIFGRGFEGWSGAGRNYYELNQEYAHLTGIHWRPEMQAYCRYNENGDLEPIVSITTRDDKDSKIALASFKWEPFEEYLVASNASLVRMYDFALFHRSKFAGWSDEPPEDFDESEHFFYLQKVMPGYAAYTRGIQIIFPRRSKKDIFSGITDGWFGQKNKKYVEFIAYDWRNNRIANISTNPSATANYFNAEGNSLPYELSPAFFRPEVLLKYKADRDKYTVTERDVSCRVAWHLEAIDVNEAGQVHAYICYLHNLPYEEQLHWLSYNEPPKETISKRAFINDFKGEFVTFKEPLQNILTIVRRWNDSKVEWWSLRDDKLLERVNTPITESRDEWAEAFMDLAKLVVEGFEAKPIRALLETAKISYEKDDKTISLLDKLLNKGNVSGKAPKLTGLRAVQLLRSKAKGHVGGKEAEKLAKDAIAEHETFANHFKYVCTQVAEDLGTIEQLFSQATHNK
jgi:hypothetical protein